MIIRDAILGDIILDEDLPGALSKNRYEQLIIRSREMQRLHRIRQLGSTYHVYPCALHTRFDHSLGAFWYVKDLLKKLEKNYGRLINRNEKQLIRFATLLHDISHISFGHMLEDDLKLFSRHDSEERFKSVLMNGEIRKFLGDSCLNEIIKILAEEPDSLKKPFYSELVKNTISADLFDYLGRDTYFTGLMRRFDYQRLSSFYNVAPYGHPKEKEHLVIMIHERGIHAPDIIREIEHILRMRFDLAERVYFYHTKIAADAMIGKAIAEACLEESFYYDKGDSELIYHLINNEKICRTTKELCNLFVERKLYSTAYMIDEESLTEKRFTPEKFYKAYGGRINSAELEKKIVKEIRKKRNDVEYKDLIAFCHDPKMNMKAALALVIDKNGKTCRASQLPYPGFEEITTRHTKLWRFYVFSRKDLISEVGKICEKEGMPGFRNKWPSSERAKRDLI